jgi:hypothetical protein
LFMMSMTSTSPLPTSTTSPVISLPANHTTTSYFSLVICTFAPLFRIDA